MLSCMHGLGRPFLKEDQHHQKGSLPRQGDKWEHMLAGANMAGSIYQPHITSYDYDCPVSEAGDIGQPGIGGDNKFKVGRPPFPTRHSHLRQLYNLRPCMSKFSMPRGSWKGKIPNILSLLKRSRPWQICAKPCSPLA